MHILIVEDNPDLVANLADFPSLCLSSHLAAVIVNRTMDAAMMETKVVAFSIQHSTDLLIQVILFHYLYVV